MAKYKLQELPDFNNDGKRKVYPKMVTNRTLSRKEFIDKMQGYHRGISPSTTAASLELKEIVHDETIPIRSVGQHSHKVWVRRKK